MHMFMGDRFWKSQRNSQLKDERPVSKNRTSRSDDRPKRPYHKKVGQGKADKNL